MLRFCRGQRSRLPHRLLLVLVAPCAIAKCRFSGISLRGFHFHAESLMRLVLPDPDRLEVWRRTAVLPSAVNGYQSFAPDLPVVPSCFAELRRQRFDRVAHVRLGEGCFDLVRRFYAPEAISCAIVPEIAWRVNSCLHWRPVAVILLRMPVASPDIDWVAVRESVVLGVPYDVVSSKFGPSVEAIKVRAFRGKWPTPTRLQRLRASRQSGDVVPADAAVVSKPPVTLDSRQGELTTETASDSLLSYGERGRLIGARLLHGLLDRAGRSPRKLARLRDAGDVVTATKGLLVAAGMDKPDAVQVNVALFGGAGSGSDGSDV